MPSAFIEKAKIIAARFRKYCRENGHTMSRRVELAMRNELEKQ